VRGDATAERPEPLMRPIDIASNMLVVPVDNLWHGYAPTWRR
jgi:hypothetical protein